MGEVCLLCGQSKKDSRSTTQKKRPRRTKKNHVLFGTFVKFGCNSWDLHEQTAQVSTSNSCAPVGNNCKVVTFHVCHENNG